MIKKFPALLVQWLFGCLHNAANDSRDSMHEGFTADDENSMGRGLKQSTGKGLPPAAHGREEILPDALQFSRKWSRHLLTSLPPLCSRW